MRPSFATPRRHDRYTGGPIAGAIIARRLGRQPTGWQQHVLDVGLERIDGPGSPYAYDKVVTIVGRRGGKTVTAMGVPLVRSLAGPVTLPNGRRVQFHGTHTAQNLVAARKRFLSDLVEPYRQRLAPGQWEAGHRLFLTLSMTTLVLDPIAGAKDLDATDRLSTLQVTAPTPTAARGDGLLHLTVDEALAFTLADGEAILSATRPTMAEMFGHAQMWITSNVSRWCDGTSWMWQLREEGREAVRTRRDTGIAYLEFSIPEGADPRDEALWWAHYPALTDGLVGIPQLRRDLEELGEAAFAAEYLGAWPPREALAAAWQAIDRDTWRAAGTDTPQPAGGRVALAVDIDPFGRAASIAAATPDPDRQPEEPPRTLVEVIDHRPGSLWVPEAAAAVLAAAPDARLMVDDYGPGRDLLLTLPEILPEDDMARVIPARSADVIAACYATDAGLREGALRWRRSDHHEALTAAAAAAQRTPGRAWQYERRVATPQQPLMACVFAAYALDHAPAPAPDAAIY